MIESLTKQRNGFLFIFLGIFLLPVTIYLFIFTTNLTFNYSLIWILPLFYMLCLLLVFIINPNIKYNKAGLLILFLYAIRMVVFPLFLNLNNGYSGYWIGSNVFLNIDSAVLIQCYEFLIVAVMIGFKKNNSSKTINDIIISQDIKKIKMIGYIIISMSAVFGSILLYYPSLLGIFRPIVMNTNDFIEWQINHEQIKRHMPLMLYHLSTWAVPLLKIILVYYFIIIIKKIMKKELLAFWLSVFLISTLVLITTDDKAGGTFAALAMLLLLFKLYPGKRKIGLGFVIIMSIIVFIVTFIMMPFRNSTENFADFIGYKLNAYFSGSINVAASLTMPRNNLAAYFAGDVLRSIPLAQGFFTNMPMSYLLFNQSLGYDTVYNSQILPCVGQSCFYFGYFGAPVFSVILILFAMRCYFKAKTTSDSFGCFIYYYLTIFLSAGVILYDFFLTLYLIMQYCLPFYVIYKLFLVKRSDQRDGNVRGASLHFCGSDSRTGRLI